MVMMMVVKDNDDDGDAKSSGLFHDNDDGEGSVIPPRSVLRIRMRERKFLSAASGSNLKPKGTRPSTSGLGKCSLSLELKSCSTNWGHEIDHPSKIDGYG